jgi:hypothetical protein
MGLETWVFVVGVVLIFAAKAFVEHSNNAEARHFVERRRIERRRAVRSPEEATFVDRRSAGSPARSRLDHLVPPASV